MSDIRIGFSHIHTSMWLNVNYTTRHSNTYKKGDNKFGLREMFKMFDMRNWKPLSISKFPPFCFRIQKLLITFSQFQNEKERKNVWVYFVYVGAGILDGRK